MNIIILFLILSITSVANADRVLLEKSTGKLIEYQTGEAPLGALTENAVNSGYSKDDVEEKYVTPDQWTAIEEENIKAPAREKKEQEKIEMEKAVVELKKKLNLTDEEWEDLKKALK